MTVSANGSVKSARIQSEIRQNTSSGHQQCCAWLIDQLQPPLVLGAYGLTAERDPLLHVPG